MKIKIVDLTEKNLGDAPEFSAYPFSCKYCLYWEYPEDFKDLEKKGKESMIKKTMWLKETRQEFGNCGKILYVDGKSVKNNGVRLENRTRPLFILSKIRKRRIDIERKTSILSIW